MGVCSRKWNLKTFYQIDQKQNVFYIALNLIDTVLFKTYLFYPDTLFKLQEQEIEIIKNNKDENNITMFIIEFISIQESDQLREHEFIFMHLQPWLGSQRWEFKSVTTKRIANRYNVIFKGLNIIFQTPLPMIPLYIC